MGHLADLFDGKEKEDVGEYDVLFFRSSDGGHDGACYAILEKDGGLFEYEDGHCSCNGFAFNPQSVTRQYLATRPVPRAIFDYDFDAVNEFKDLQKKLREAHVPQEGQAATTTTASQGLRIAGAPIIQREYEFFRGVIRDVFSRYSHQNAARNQLVLALLDKILPPSGREIP